MCKIVIFLYSLSEEIEYLNQLETKKVLLLTVGLNLLSKEKWDELVETVMELVGFWTADDTLGQGSTKRDWQANCQFWNRKRKKCEVKPEAFENVGRGFWRLICGLWIIRSDQRYF